MVRGVLLAGALLLCSGCYQNVPVGVSALVPNRDVKVELTRVGFAKLPELPEHPGPDLSGTVLRVENGELLLRVPVLVRTDGLVTGTIRQDLSIPTADIVDVSQRQFSRKRTALVVGGAAAILAGVFTAFDVGGPPSGQQPNQPPDEEAGARALIAVPLFSIFR